MKLEFFVGKQLSSNFLNFEEGEKGAGHEFYKMITNTYSCNDEINITFSPKNICSQKMIAFVPQFCHCCT
jgi:hypothetical protein